MLPRLVKWPGGKERLLPQYEPFLPEGAIAEYYEPCVGGGAMFFFLRQQGRLTGYVRLSDSNPYLINLYQVCRDDPDGLCAAVQGFQDRYVEPAVYYRVRDEFNAELNQVRWGDVYQAARFLFLTRASINGLVRFRKLPPYTFNPPVGYQRKGDEKVLNKVFFPDDIRQCSILLQGVDLRCESIEWLQGFERQRQGGICLMFVDPPYSPVKKGAFNAYHQPFGEDKQMNLVPMLEHCAQQGAIVLTANSTSPTIDLVYGSHRKHIVQAARSINRDGSKRGPVDEYLIEVTKTHD